MLLQNSISIIFLSVSKIGAKRTFNALLKLYAAAASNMFIESPTTPL